MFPVMLLSTVCSVLFAFCGLMGLIAFVLKAERHMSMSEFLQGFTGATWPLLVACALFLLQFILKEIIALREAAEADEPAKPARPRAAALMGTAPEAPDAAPVPPTPAAKPGPVYFPVRETPQGPRIVRPAEETPSAPSPAPAAPAEESGLTFFKTR